MKFYFVFLAKIMETFSGGGVTPSFGIPKLSHNEAYPTIH